MKLDPQRAGGRAGQRRERAILVGLELPDRAPTWKEPLEELRAPRGHRGRRAGARPSCSAAQRPDPATFIGKGKAAEVGAKRKALGADLVIVDHDLSPSQARNLEKALGGRVIDRTELILDIFVRRARTGLAKLQVELAQMEYALPRLKRLWTHLNREVGVGGGPGSGSAGPGEKQIETDRRLVRNRIRDLRLELAEQRAHRERQTAGPRPVGSPPAWSATRTPGRARSSRP